MWLFCKKAVYVIDKTDEFRNGKLKSNAKSNKKNGCCTSQTKRKSNTLSYAKNKLILFTRQREGKLTLANGNVHQHKKLGQDQIKIN